MLYQTYNFRHTMLYHQSNTIPLFITTSKSLLNFHSSFQNHLGGSFLHSRSWICFHWISLYFVYVYIYFQLILQILLFHVWSAITKAQYQKARFLIISSPLLLFLAPSGYRPIEHYLRVVYSMHCIFLCFVFIICIWMR